MNMRGLPPLFGAPWEREQRVEVYSLSEAGRAEVDVDSIHSILMRAHEALNSLFVDFSRRRQFQREAAMLAAIMESIGEFDSHIKRQAKKGWP